MRGGERVSAQMAGYDFNRRVTLCPTRITCVALKLLALVALMFATPSEAAVRVCRKPIIGDIVEDQNRVSALKGAIDSWRRKSETFGKQYGSWRLAVNRSNKCGHIVAKNMFACVAVGRPCSVRQVPPKRGFGDRPPRRLPHPPLKPPAHPDAPTNQRQI